jgi:type I restriction enzyme S subunit
VQALIKLPSLPEQETIASFLSAIDAKIQNTSSQIEQMETFKKGLLQQMFV